MTGRTSPRPSWKRARLLLAVVALLALVVGPAAVNGTLAGWQDSKESYGEFSSGSLGPVRNLKCQDSGLAGSGLLASEIQLNWSAPENVNSSAVTYEIVVNRNPLLGSPTTTTETVPATTRVITETRLLATASYTITIQPKLGAWAGAETSQGATVLLGLRFGCS